MYIKPCNNIGEGYLTTSNRSVIYLFIFKKGAPIMVYVLNQKGQPLMPTSRYGKVRHLIKDGKAKVVNRCPFTIQLLYKSTNHTQELILGVDAGSKTIGLSASTEKKELYSGEVILRTDIVELLSTRRESRRTRRNRKTRYRKCRFLNRLKTKHKGWVAPSIQNKIKVHLSAIEKIHQVLPITKIIVEVAAFDTQLLKATEQQLEKPKGSDYQKGEQLNFFNAREYVFFRDNHQCQCCKGKSKDKVLNVHHIESRKTGGDAPNILITLCETCHTKYHKGLLSNFKPKRGQSYRDAAFMGIMRWMFYSKLKEMYPDVSFTYGYLTKNTRIKYNLPKEHRIDALCIAKHPKAVLADEYFLQKKVRCHNRQIHKCKINKGGTRKLNQAPKYVFGYQLFDKVQYHGQECFIFGRRKTGYFDLRLVDGTKISASVSYKKLRLLETRKSTLIERRIAGQAAFLPLLK